tara:strand:+ start:1497 stop:2513 length:1017 start_codon:yes stop_codon:yes gene_type:complete
MPKFQENYCLKNLNTFAIKAKTKYYTTFKSINELKDIISSKIYKNNKSFILAGGSNILITQNFNGLILHNKILGIEILNNTEKHTIVKVGAGVIWQDFVDWSLEKNLSGIENLSLIPGSVGASPVQNIGAYGVEIKNYITKVITFDLEKNTTRIFSNKECQFEYRNSIFKMELKNKILITHVEFKLYKTNINEISYGDIQQELKKLKLNPSPKNISTAVINIRNKKIPNPKILANSGSFFKNPIISTEKFNSLKKDFPEIIGYKISENKTKVAAGWLIENAGLKGYRNRDAGIHKKQALVIVNYKNASGKDILNLANKIQKIIFEKYKIQIVPEVNIL